MKKINFTFIFLMSCTVLYGQADSASFTLPKTIIKISPLQFAIQTFEIGIEQFNSAYSKSFNVSAGIRTGSNNYENGFGGGIELGFRKYAAPMKFRVRNNRESYQGIYYGFFARGDYFKGEDAYYNSGSNTIDKISSIGAGFTIGFQKTIWQIIILDMYVGGAYRYSDIQQSGYYNGQPDYRSTYDIFDPGYTGIYPKIGLKIGIGL